METKNARRLIVFYIYIMQHMQFYIVKTCYIFYEKNNLINKRKLIFITSLSSKEVNGFSKRYWNNVI